MAIDQRPFANVLSHIVDNRGRTCPTAPNGIPLIATNCIDETGLFPIYEKIRYVSEETYRTWFRGHPLPDDIIFVCKGSPGNVCLTPDPVGFCIAQDMVAVRADDKQIYPRYLFAALRSREVRTQIANLHVGTMIPHFKKGDFDKLIIPIPDKPVQRAIGDLYYDLSAKIEVNTSVSRLSMTLLQASWTKFASEGVRRRPLDEIVTLDKGVSYKGSGLGSGAPMVNLGNFSTEGVFRFDGLKRYSGETRKLHWVRSGDLVLANTDLTQKRLILGQPALVDVGDEPAIFTHHVFAVRPVEAALEDILWLYAGFRDESFRERAMGFATGTTVTALSKDAILSYEMPWPDAKVRHDWEIEARMLLERSSSAQRESRALVELRDALLPKLMSGEFLVKSGASSVAAV